VTPWFCFPLKNWICRAIATILLCIGATGAVGNEIAITPSAAKTPARFGIVAFRPKPETVARWQPLIDYLNSTQPSQPISLVVLNYPELADAVKQKQVDFVLTQLIGGIQSGMGYLGAADLTDLRSKARFIRVTSAGQRESAPHDVIEVKATK